MKEHFLIIYDFTNNSRRAKFVKVLEKYGIRIQYSVFEFFLTKARKTELLAKLRKEKFLENNKNEAVMIIPISLDVAKKIERFGDTIDIIGKSGIFSI
jgi:CRISPR-associated protein Cas2